MLLVLLSMIGFVITTRLWKWYDSIINLFSYSIRVLDIFTWGFILWFILNQYQKRLSSIPQLNLWGADLGTGLENMEILFTSLQQFCNFYTWCGLTVIGFIIIGFLRLFIKKDLFSK